MTSKANYIFLTKKKIILIAMVAFLAAFRLYLPTLAKNHINGLLNQDPIYAGHIEDVRIHLWRGAYSLVRLNIKRVKGQEQFPLISADDIDIGLSWKEVLHAAVRVKLDVKNLVVNIVEEKEDGRKKVAIGRDTVEGKKQEAQDWKSTFKKIVPIDVGRLKIAGQSIHFRDLTSKPKINLFLDHLEIQGENLTNSEKVSKSLFGTVDIQARAMESGKLHVVLYTNPLASPPELKITTQLTGLDLTSLNDFFTAYGSFDVKSGTLDAYSEIATADNNLKGYIKPIMKNLAVADLKKDTKKGGVIHAAWEVLVGAIGGIFKNHSNEHQAARIAFEGRLDDPKTSSWETFKSAVYNAFIKPISPSLEHSVGLKDVKKTPKRKS